MPKLIERSTGKEFDIPDAYVERALASGDYEAADGAVLTGTSDRGIAVAVPLAEASIARAEGFTPDTARDALARERQVRIQREHGGIGGRIATAAEEFASAATLGGYDAAGRLIGGDEFAERRREQREANPLTATVSGVAGAVAPGLLSGGTGTLGSIARATPAGALTRATGGMGLKGMILEGAAMGAGQGLADVALSEDPVTVERVVSGIGSGALYGGSIAGGVGITGKVLGKGISKANGLVKGLREAAEKRATVADDLAKLDKAGLREAERTARQELGESVVAEARAINESSDLFKATLGGDKRVLTKGRIQIRSALDDPRGLADSQYAQGAVAKSLRKEEEVIRKIIADQDGALAKLQAADRKVAEKIAAELDELESGKILLTKDKAALYGDLNGIPVGKGGITLSRDAAEEFIEQVKAGGTDAMRRKAVDALPMQLEKNLQTQKIIADIKEGTAPRLAEIRQAMDNLSGGAPPKGLVEKAVEGSAFGMVTGAVAPMAGPLAPLIGGSVANKLTDLIFRRGGKVAGAAADRTAAAVDAFLAAGKMAAPVVRPTATKTLLSTAFAPPSRTEAALDKKGLANQPTSLADAFMKRRSEILSQVQMSPDTGELVMRPSARAQVAARLDGVRVADPILADKIETHAARRMTFLASKLPKKPDVYGLGIGPDKWRPSEMAMRAFARYVAAVEDPGAVEERVAAGSVTPEDAEAMRAVYPERFADFQQQIMQRLPELRKKLPYRKRLSLSIFSGVAVDPALDPAILSVLQGNFAEEPGTGGGMEPPKAQPQFGSISRPEPTVAQERAAG